jgi:hypothetical protein
MEFQRLIHASSIVKVVLGRAARDAAAAGDLAASIEKLQADLRSFDAPDADLTDEIPSAVNPF